MGILQNEKKSLMEKFTNGVLVTSPLFCNYPFAPPSIIDVAVTGI